MSEIVVFSSIVFSTRCIFSALWFSCPKIFRTLTQRQHWRSVTYAPNVTTDYVKVSKKSFIIFSTTFQFPVAELIGALRQDKNT